MYVTMSKTKASNADTYSGWDEEEKFHHAYETQDDAENVIKAMANDASHIDGSVWIVDRHPTGLCIYNEDPDYSEDYVEFSVQRLKLRPAGCTVKVELHQEIDGEEIWKEREEEREEEEEDDDDEEEDDKEVEIIDVRPVRKSGLSSTCTVSSRSLRPLQALLLCDGMAAEGMAAVQPNDAELND